MINMIKMDLYRMVHKILLQISEIVIKTAFSVGLL